MLQGRLNTIIQDDKNVLLYFVEHRVATSYLSLSSSAQFFYLCEVTSLYRAFCCPCILRCFSKYKFLVSAGISSLSFPVRKSLLSLASFYMAWATELRICVSVLLTYYDIGHPIMTPDEHCIHLFYGGRQAKVCDWSYDVTNVVTGKLYVALTYRTNVTAPSSGCT